MEVTVGGIVVRWVKLFICRFQVYDSIVRFVDGWKHQEGNRQKGARKSIDLDQIAYSGRIEYQSAVPLSE